MPGICWAYQPDANDPRPSLALNFAVMHNTAFPLRCGRIDPRIEGSP